MAMSGDKLKRTRLQLAIAAVLVVSACSPMAHRDGTAGGDSATMVRIGDAARDAGDPAEALPLYQRAHRLDPQNPTATLRIAETFNQLGAYHEAGDVWSSFLRLNQKHVDALVGYGNTLIALRQPQLALEYFRRAQAVRGTPEALNGIGVAHDMLGHAAKAQEAYRSSLAIAPDSLRASNNLALSLALSGHFAEAIELLEAVVERPDAGVRHRQNLALAYGLGGFSERAQAVGLQDLDDLAVQRNMTLYRLIGDISGHAAKVAALGAHTGSKIVADGLVAQNATMLR